jgi:hypothetical protein
MDGIKIPSHTPGSSFSALLRCDASLVIGIAIAIGITAILVFSVLVLFIVSNRVHKRK